jgi:hypothetical protein
VAEILDSEIVARRMDGLPRAPCAGEAAPPPDGAVDMLRTIHVPRRFNDLSKALPPSRYDPPPASCTEQPAEAAGGTETVAAPAYPESIECSESIAAYKAASQD